MTGQLDFDRQPNADFDEFRDAIRDEIRTTIREEFSKLHRRMEQLENVIPYCAYLLTHHDAQNVIEAMRQYAVRQSFKSQPQDQNETMKVPD